MNIDIYKKDLSSLISQGQRLKISMLLETNRITKEKIESSGFLVKDLPVFSSSYQEWYSESHRLIQQLLPSRLKDFEFFYKLPGTRKQITAENYTISDYLKGLNITQGWEKTKIVGPDAAIPAFEQQLNIISGLAKRFESSLYDIKVLVQADLFNDELDAASELNKKGFSRGAGAMAGVVMENHLQSVCAHHNETPPKNAMLGKLNEFLREKSIIDLPTWRFIQHLTDLRNLCDHKLTSDPTKEQVTELIEGTRKITKTVW